jgi:hypothetical protein
MKHFITLSVFALLVTACEKLPQVDVPTCGVATPAVVISYSKEGNPIYDDQAPLIAPCPVGAARASEPPTISTPPVTPPKVPPVIYPPVENPPTMERVKPNSGRGNGSELDENGHDVDPGNSGAKNRGGD